MATKEMRVCDLCNKLIVGNVRTVIIDGTEYNEVCENCIGKLNTFIKRLGTPYDYSSRKKAKTEAETAEATPAEAVLAETVPAATTTAPKGLLGKKK